MPHPEEREARLEGWPLAPILRDAVLRTAPQDEASFHSAAWRGCTFCNATHTVAGEAGIATSSVPRASVMALITAAGAAIAPASPQPLMPSGFEGHFVSVVSTLNGGR